jgi:hypothetical protein
MRDRKAVDDRPKVIGVRLDEGRRRRLEELVARMREEEPTATQSDALRLVFDIGLAAKERAHGITVEDR